MLQILILVFTARASTRLILGRTPAGPKTQCKLKRAGIRISIIIPAPYPSSQPIDLLPGHHHSEKDI
jgi:hypothetical protein